MKKIFILFILSLSISNLLIAQTDNIVKAVFIDEFGVKWFGSDIGLIRFDGTTWIDYGSHDKIPGQISAIEYQSSDDGSEMWIGSKSGASVAAYDVDGVTSATLYTTDNSGLLTNSINDIVLDKDDVRYFATSAGLGIFNENTWLSIEKGSEIPNTAVLSLGYKNDTIYVGSDGKGVGRLIKDDVDAYSGATYYEIPWAGLANNTINRVYIDSKGYQWYGTTEGVSRHVVQETQMGWDIYLTTEQGLINGNVKSILEDSEGDIWFGTEGGISKYNLAESSFTNFTIEDGLPDNKIYDIAMDNDQTLWFATGKGVSHFDGTHFINYMLMGGVNMLTQVDNVSGKIYPNPATNSIQLKYYTKVNGIVTITAFDLTGQIVKSIYNRYVPAGELNLTWNLNDTNDNQVSSGIYFITFRSGSYMNSQKVVVIR